MTTTLATPKELLSLSGAQLGTSNWIEITQDQVNKFADATGDHQWIRGGPRPGRSAARSSTAI